MTTGNAAADLGTTLSADQKLQTLASDQAWRDRLLHGNGPEYAQFIGLLNAKEAEGEAQLDRIVAGTETPPRFETVSDGRLSISNQITAAEWLREQGHEPTVIKQILASEPVSKSDYDAILRKYEDHKADPEFTAAYLRGDRDARRLMDLFHATKAVGFKEDAK